MCNQWDSQTSFVDGKLVTTVWSTGVVPLFFQQPDLPDHLPEFPHGYCKGVIRPREGPVEGDVFLNDRGPQRGRRGQHQSRRKCECARDITRAEPVFCRVNIQHHWHTVVQRRQLTT